MLSYGRQWVDEDDIQAVVEVLRSGWLTTGPAVSRFEEAFAEAVGTQFGVAVSSGTAALHCAMHALGIGAGDEVIVPSMTFPATANSVVFQGGNPVFADVEPDTLLIDPDRVEAAITPGTKAIIAVDYAGQPCDYDALRSIADRHELRLVADACHALGGAYKGQVVGSLADLNIFSLHPVKPITAGEGGVVTTDDPQWAALMRRFREHGIARSFRERAEQNTWVYEMVDLGYNYRLTDIQCALGLSQLKKLTRWAERRREIARFYDAAFADVGAIEPLTLKPDVSHAYHLYVIRLNAADPLSARSLVFSALREKGVGVAVHYPPVHLHPYYRNRFGTCEGLCPATEAAYERILTLPLFAAMSDDEVRFVADTVVEVARGL